MVTAKAEGAMVVEVERPWATGLVELHRGTSPQPLAKAKVKKKRRLRCGCGALALGLVIFSTLATAAPIFAVWKILASRSMAQVSEALMAQVAAETLSVLKADVSAVENIVERNALFAEIAGVFSGNETHTELTQQWRIFTAESLVKEREYWFHGACDRFGELTGTYAKPEFLLLFISRDYDNGTYHKFRLSFNSTGDVVIGESLMEMVSDFRTRDWYIAAAAHPGEVRWSPPGVGSSTGYLLLFVSRSWSGPCGPGGTEDLCGVFVATMTMDGIGNKMKSLVIGKSGSAWLIEQGTLFLVASSTNASIGSSSGPGGVAFRVRVNESEHALTREIGHLFEPGQLFHGEASHGSMVSATLLGVPHHVYAVDTSLRIDRGLVQMLIVVALPQSDYFSSVKQSSIITSAIAVSVVVLTALVASLVIVCFTRPLKLLTDDLNRVASLEEISDEPMPRAMTFCCTRGWHITEELTRLASSVERVAKVYSSIVRFVPLEVIRSLSTMERAPTMSLKRRRCAVLFVDLHGFTEASEMIGPQELASLLQRYYQAITDAVSATSGLVDKFLGDGAMAFWGFPLSEKQIEERACVSALLLHQLFEQLCDEAAAQGFPALTCRIGVATGMLSVGFVGSNERLNFTLLGPTVNLASRLEQLNKLLAGKSILVCEQTADVAKGTHLFAFAGRWMIRGMKDPQPVYNLIAARDDASDETIRLVEEHNRVVETLDRTGDVGPLSEFSRTHPTGKIAHKLVSIVTGTTTANGIRFDADERIFTPIC